ncbi:MAG TPA: hypothetical protein VFL97_07215 [Nitrococcus sp.]|nr:hypothetical protein [Nitrococcus sp.]
MAVDMEAIHKRIELNAMRFAEKLAAASPSLEELEIQMTVLAEALAILAHRTRTPAATAHALGCIVAGSCSVDKAAH